MKIAVKIIQFEDNYYLIPNTRLQKFDELTSLYFLNQKYSKDCEDVLNDIEMEFGDFIIEDLNEIQLYKNK